MSFASRALLALALGGASALLCVPRPAVASTFADTAASGRLETGAVPVPAGQDGVDLANLRIDWTAGMEKGRPVVKVGLQATPGMTARFGGQVFPISKAPGAERQAVHLLAAGTVIEADVLIDGAVMGTLRFDAASLPVSTPLGGAAMTEVPATLTWGALFPGMHPQVAVDAIALGLTLANPRVRSLDFSGLERLRDRYAPGHTIAHAKPPRATTPTQAPANGLPLLTSDAGPDPALALADAQQLPIEERRYILEILAREGSAAAAMMRAEDLLRTGGFQEGFGWAVIATQGGVDGASAVASALRTAEERAARRLHRYDVALDAVLIAQDGATARARLDVLDRRAAKALAGAAESPIRRVDALWHRARGADALVARLMADGPVSEGSTAMDSHQNAVLAVIAETHTRYSELRAALDEYSLPATLPGRSLKAGAAAWPELYRAAVVREKALAADLAAGTPRLAVSD
jgi:hypothetical protein